MSPRSGTSRRSTTASSASTAAGAPSARSVTRRAATWRCCWRPAAPGWTAWWRAERADLAALPAQTAASRPGARAGAGPGATANWAVAAFGADGLAEASPARRRVRARVLYGIAATDDLVPWAQATAFARSQRARDPGAYVDTERLRGGRRPFVHGEVSAAALKRFHDRERALVAPLERGRRRVAGR